MSYRKRLDRAFVNAPVLMVTSHSKYVFFSDCHRGIGNNNDNFLKNASSYYAALQYYYQYGFCYVEAGDGDELWENRDLCKIMEIHEDIFRQLCRFQNCGRLYMLYGNHDMEKKDPKTQFADFPVYESLIFQFQKKRPNLYVTHGHQADGLNSAFWKLARFLVRYLWTPLESFGVHDPTSAAQNNTKKEKLEKKYIRYAQSTGCLLLTGHTHRPTLHSDNAPYCNCGSCIHPKGVTCIELCDMQLNLVKWYSSTKKSEHFGNIYAQCPPSYPIYIKREVLASVEL